MFKPEDMGVTTCLSLNGRLFITPMEHLDALVSSQIVADFVRLRFMLIFVMYICL